MEGDQYVLEISNNGIGMDENFDFKEEKTLGVQLIQMLVVQLDANLEINRKNGTGYRIRFSALTYKKRV